MNGFSRLAFVETKLFLREKAATLAVFGLPVALVIGFGLIPGFGQPQKGLSDQIGTEYIASLGVAIVLATLGLNGVPMVIGQYRERGILRRLGVTPVRPLTLLVAKLTVWAASAIVSVAFVIAVVRIAFHVPMPAAPGWFAVSVLLGIGSVFALGMVAAGPDRPQRGRDRLAAVLPEHVPGRHLLPDRGNVVDDAPDRQLHPARLGPACGAGQLDGPGSATRIPGHNGGICRDRGGAGGSLLPLGTSVGKGMR